MAIAYSNIGVEAAPTGAASRQIALQETTVNGVVVYTTTESQTQELRERFHRMVAPPDPPLPWRQRLLDLLR